MTQHCAKDVDRSTFRFPHSLLRRPAMRCLICDRAIDANREPAVATTSGGHMHVACGDPEACAAHRMRALRAAPSGGVLVGLGVLAADAGEGGVSLLLVVAFAAGHVLANRRWWRRSVLSIRLRLRRRF